MVANLRAFVNEPHPPAQYAGVDRRIALIKPPLGEDERATHAMELLDSVFWVFKGTTHSNWITTSPDEADVIFVHHAEQAQRVENWRNAGKLIAVISTDEAVLPASTYTIVYPFPTVQVLRMLERIENALNVGQSAEPDGFVAARESIDIRGVDAWSFVEALRLLGAVRNPDTWFIGGTPSGPLLWLQGDGSRYYCDAATASAIRRGTLDLSRLTVQKGAPPPAFLSSRPGVELVWFASYQASATLAPRLNEGAAYRLIRWPDFGLLRQDDSELCTAQIRVAAALDALPTTPATLAARAKVSLEQAARTLNALVGCELVEVAPSAKNHVSRADNDVAVPTGRIRLFLRNIRRHLRLAVPE